MAELEFVRALGNSLTVPGLWVAGQTLHMSWTGVEVDSPCGPYFYAADMGYGSTDLGAQAYSASQLSGSRSMPITATADHVAFVAYTDSYCSGGRLTGFEWWADPPPEGYCRYGTRLKGAAAAAYYITPTLLDTWLDHLGMPWLARVLAGFYYSTLDAAALCGSGPPPFPTIDLSTITASATTAWTILRAVAWANVCECVPGPDPIAPYPDPSAPQPTGWPAEVTFDCDPAMLCVTLEAIQRELAAVLASQSQMAQLVTLLQRYTLPFAYIEGAVHSALSGTGSFAISRLVGLRVVVDNAEELRAIGGNPPYLWDAGWISVSDPDGMIEERRPSRAQLTWLPRLAPTATLFAWFLPAGVTITVTELQAEP